MPSRSHIRSSLALAACRAASTSILSGTGSYTSLVMFLNGNLAVSTTCATTCIFLNIGKCYIRASSRGIRSVRECDIPSPEKRVSLEYRLRRLVNPRVERPVFVGVNGWSGSGSAVVLNVKAAVRQSSYACVRFCMHTGLQRTVE